jgi:alpha-mannosidase
VLSIVGVVSTYCFVRAPGGPAQVVRLDVDSPVATEAEAWAEGPGLSCPVHWRGRLLPGRTRAEVAVEVPPGTGAGSKLVMEAVVSCPGVTEARQAAELEVREPGWAMYMVSHFHYDPVWWNTQAGYTSAWDQLAWAQDARETFQHSGLVLVEAHLERARLDPDYKFVLAEVDYLKPFWDLYPDRRHELRRLLDEGRLEVVGGTYNEPSTNLIAFETAVRCAVYGMGFQRDVMGARPESAWQLDVFGHDPSFPTIMAGCGITSGAWARGPFHQWGPKHHTGSTTWMQFPSEFEWLGPDGTGLLTCYMADHYSAGWQLDRAATLEEAMQSAYDLFCDLAAVSATKAVLLPVGTDYTPPNKWVTQLARAWSERYEWPRFVPAVPRELFAAVRAELAGTGRSPSPQTRDMGPVYTGKDVSFIDTKQAHRLAESALVEAEKLATFALALGHDYPHRAADRAWRQLVFNSHHDGITGSESDQVYLDLLGGWREAYDLASAVRTSAMEAIASHISIWASSVVVFNSLTGERDGLVSVVVPLPEPGANSVAVRDARGREVLAISAPTCYYDDGTVSEARVDFLATAVPGLGYSCYSVEPDRRPPRGWAPVEGLSARNDCYSTEADPARGGCLARVTDLASGWEVLRPGEVGNELLVYPEHATHPKMAEGPWHLMPAGPPVRSSARAAQVRAERSCLGERLVVSGELDGMSYTQVVTLFAGYRRIELRTCLHGFSGRDRLVRLRFPVAVDGGTPLAEVGNAVVARSAGFVDHDSAEVPWTLDTPAQGWAGTGATFAARFVSQLAGGGRPVGSHALGVAEVVVPAGMSPRLHRAVRGLLVALVQKGVTASCTEAGSNRYGSLLGDSNLPDVRICIGRPEHNPLAAAVLGSAGRAFRAELDTQLASRGTARCWAPAARPPAGRSLPGTDLRGARDLPVLLVAGVDEAWTARAVAELAGEAGNGHIVVHQPASLFSAGAGTVPPEAAGRTAVVLNRGTPGFVVDASGAVHVSLLRSCTGWPSGVWIDPPRRTAPDGSAFELEHWSHVFDHALMAGEGDWRALGCTQEAQAFNTPLVAVAAGPRPGPSRPAELLPTGSLVLLRAAGGTGTATAGSEPRRGTVVLSVLKPAGNPLAAGRLPGERGSGALEVCARLYESAGYPAVAVLRAVAPWRVEKAWRTNLLEEQPEALDCLGGEVALDFAPAQVLTVRLLLGRAAPPTGPGATGPGATGPGALARVGPAQPVFSRYWLHNKGPAPMGNQLLAVHLGPTSVRARAGTERISLVATVSSCATEGTQAGLEIVVPPDWSAKPPSRLFNLAPQAHARLALEVVPPPRARSGRYFVAARLQEGTGREGVGREGVGPEGVGRCQEDVVTIDILPSSAVAPYGEEPSDLPAPFDHPSGQVASELEAHFDSDSVRVAPGGRGVLHLVLINRTRSELRGEAQLVSPLETWPFAGPWSQGFAVPVGGTTRVPFAVDVPAGSGPLLSWLLVKVMYFGRRWYSEAVPFEIVPGPRS